MRDFFSFGELGKKKKTPHLLSIAFLYDFHQASEEVKQMSITQDKHNTIAFTLKEASASFILASSSTELIASDVGTTCNIFVFFQR